MADKIRTRIRQILHDFDCSVYELGKRSCRNTKTLNNQINGTTTVSAEILMLILTEFPEVSAEWLLRGEGPMLLSTHTAAGTNNIQVDHINGGFNFASGGSTITTSDQQVDALKSRITELEERISEQKELLNFYRAR